jgi:6-phosphofructokinase 2
MIVTVTINPCIDKSTSIEQLQPETKLRCSQLVNEPGGGGINVSKALKELGVEALALFPAGGHNGNMLCTLLKEEAILFKALETKTETRENWVVLETSGNKQYRFTFPGLPVSPDLITALIDQLPSLAPSFIVASGSLPPGLPENAYALIVEKATAIGAKCIIDTSGPALEALKGKKAFLIKPNAGELCKLLNIQRLEKDEVPATARRIIEDGYATLIAVSMAEKGAWLVSAGEAFFCAPPPVKKQSTVGAGDSMVAGMVYMFQHEASLEDTLKFGVACGTAATMNAGTQLFDKNEAFRLFNEMGGKI